MLSLLTLLSCLTSPKDYKDLRDLALDHDQDGYVSADYPEEGGDDCDDERPETHPGAPEGCDGLDNDCDGTIDEGVTELEGVYYDRDRDSYGGEAVSVCPLPEDVSGTPGDCDDNNGAINPLATDVAGDGRDQNCDGIDGTDGDRDGVASVESGGGDCNDSNVTAFPGAEEVCYDIVDNDCDSSIDEGTSSSCLLQNMLQITEFNTNSVATHPLGEWFELMNISEHPLNLNGIQVEITNGGKPTPAFRISENTIIESGEIFVFCFSKTTLNSACNFAYGDSQTHSTSDLSIPNLSLSMGSILVTIDGESITGVGYIVNEGSTYPTAPESVNGGSSFEFPFDEFNIPYPADTSTTWCRNTTDIYYTVTEDGVDYSDYGTPGAPNTCTKE